MDGTARLNIIILGLSITSSWGNGHATTYRGLVRELSRQGHRVLFLERDAPWYATNRDLPSPDYCTVELYESLEELHRRFTAEIREADAVIVGSYVPDGIAVGDFVQRTARGVAVFYDIDTPVTIAAMRRHDCSYLAPELIPGYHLYLSFTGGAILSHLEHHYGSPAARALYCSVDPESYRPLEDVSPSFDLGYLGTWSADRQPTLDKLLVEPAKRWEAGKFAVYGPQYPDNLRWPRNVERAEHLPPADHPRFYNSQRFTLNVTRGDMIRAGFCPSVRLFEAASCGTPIISDWWNGLETLFEIGREILISDSPSETLDYLRNTSEKRRREIGFRARGRILREHTAAHRAAEMAALLREAMDRRAAMLTRVQGTTLNAIPEQRQ